MMFHRFPPNSRYHGTPVRTHVTSDGQEIVHLARRFVPHPDRLSLLEMHRVAEGERPDHVAAHRLGDPELFWRLADGNRVLDPAELTREVGRLLRVTLPEGVAGPEEGGDPHA